MSPAGWKLSLSTWTLRGTCLWLRKTETFWWEGGGMVLPPTGLVLVSQTTSFSIFFWKMDNLLHSNLTNIPCTHTINRYLARRKTRFLVNQSFLRSGPCLSLLPLDSPGRTRAIRALCNHITNWSTLIFLFHLKPKWEKGSTDLTRVSQKGSLFPNTGLISIIRKTKGTKAPVSSTLITLLVIGATIEIQDETKKLEITRRRVTHGSITWREIGTLACAG